MFSAGFVRATKKRTRRRTQREKQTGRIGQAWLTNNGFSLLCPVAVLAQTVILLLFAQWSIVSVVILPWFGWSFHVPLYTALSMLALISHCRAQFTNPGAVPRDRLPPPPVVVGVQPDGKEVFAQAPRICRKCKTLKPWKAHHCSTCGRCMIRMDHHCPWVNNCVAIYNQKYFLLFLLYTATCCLYCGILLVARFISCTNNLKACSLSGLQAVAAIVNFIEAVIFGLFCTIMMWDQLSAIFDNTPGIDALQHKHGVARGRYESLMDVFGEPLCWRWWLPFDLPRKVAADFEAELQLLEDPLVTEMKQTHGEGDESDSSDGLHGGHGGHRESLGPLLEAEQDFTEDRGEDAGREIDIGAWEHQQQQRQRHFERSTAEMHGPSAAAWLKQQQQQQQQANNGHGHSHGPGSKSHSHSHGPTPMQQQQQRRQAAAGGGAESIADSLAHMHNRSSKAARSSGPAPIVFPDVISYGQAQAQVQAREDASGEGLDPALALLQSPPHSPLLTAQQAAVMAMASAERERSSSSASNGSSSGSGASSSKHHAHAK